MKENYLASYYSTLEHSEQAFNKMMGYPLEAVEQLAERAKEINRKRLIELNNRDLHKEGIEKD